MADEFRNAGIGVNFDINGMQQLIKLNDMVNQTISSFKQLVTGVQEADTAIGRFGQSGSRHLNGISDAFRTTIASNRLLNDDVKKTQSSFNDFKPDQINKITDAMKDTMVSNRLLNDDLKSTNSAINDIKTTGIDNLNRAVKDTNTSVLHMRQSVSDAKGQVADIPTAGFDRLTGSINQTKDPFYKLDEATKQNTKHWWQFGKQTEDSTHKLSIFKGTALGTFAGNEIQSGLSSLTSGLKSAVTQGLQFNAATADIKKQWSQIGLSDNQTNSMVNQIASIRQHADISAASITNMQKQYLTLTGGNVQQAQALTNSVTAFGTESGMGNSTMSGAGQGSNSNNINRLISGGANTKINARMFQRTFGQSPQFAQEIIKQSDMSKAAFYSLLNSGKMTSAELREDLIKASSDASHAWSNYANTTQGRMSALKMTVANSKKAFDVNLTAGLFDALKQQAANGGQLDKMQATVQAIAKQVGQVLGRTIGSVVGFLTKNIGPIKETAGAIWDIVKALASGAWSVISGLLGTIGAHGKQASNSMQSLASGLQGLAKHTTAIKILGGTILGLVGAFKILKGVMVAVNLVTEMSPIGWIITGIAAVTLGVVELYKHFKPFRDAVNGVGQAFKDAFGLGIKWGKELFNYFKPALKQMVAEFKAELGWIGKIFKDTWKIVEDIFKGVVNFFKDYIRIYKDIFTGNFKDLKKVVPQLFTDMWNFIKNIAGDAWKFMNDLTGGMLDKMVDLFKDGFNEVHKVWDDAWTSIGHFFEGIWDWIKQIVSDGINGVLNVINVGIKAIDGAISMFGGSSQAIKPLQMVHLATGTGALADASGPRRAITQPTMAVLNDGNDSPETGNREMIMHPNGMSELVNGVNTKRMLEPGAEVLNAKETKLIMQNYGMQGSPADFMHFAKGTGFFSKIGNGIEHAASSVWNGAKGIVNSIAGKLKFAQNLIKGPEGWIKSLFGQAKEKGSVLTDLASGMINTPVNAAKNWASELGKMISGALDDGGAGASGLLAAVEKYGRGKRYVWGATGPDSFDCSGLVQYALEHAFGIHYPRVSGAQIATAQHVSAAEAQPGDLVGNAGHIGVYAGNGKYWAAASPDSQPNIGMWPVSAFPDGAYSYGRVQGIKNTSKKSSGGSALQKLIKSETGGMLGWIAKHLAPLLSGSGSDGNSPAGVMSKSDFNRTAQEAAQIMHTSLSSNDLAKLYWQAFDESTVNPATGGGYNDHDGTGLPVGLFQYKQGTWDAYSVSGHSNIHSALDQMLAVMNDRNWRSDIAPDGVGVRSGWSPSGGRARRNGGPVDAGKWYQVNEDGQELFKPSVPGRVLNHNESKHIVNNSKRPITINAPMTVNLNGGHDDKELETKLAESHNRFLRALSEKIANELGGDPDNGGVYPI